MHTLARVACGLVLACASLATLPARAADDKVDVTGVWNAEVELAGNQGTPVFTLKQDGDKLTGKYKGQFGEADITGKIKGKEIEFSFEIQGGGKAVYTGEVDKDAMQGKCNYADQASGTWTGKKAPPKSS